MGARGEEVDEGVDEAVATDADGAPKNSWARWKPTSAYTTTVAMAEASPARISPRSIRTCRRPASRRAPSSARTVRTGSNSSVRLVPSRASSWMRPLMSSRPCSAP